MASTLPLQIPNEEDIQIIHHVFNKPNFLCHIQTSKKKKISPDLIDIHQLSLKDLCDCNVVFCSNIESPL